MISESLLKDLVNGLKDYDRDSRLKLNDKRNFYRNLKIADAIKNAAMGMVSKEKMDSHQYRIGRVKCKIAADELIKHLDDLQVCKQFNDIFNITEQVKNEITGLGNLWSYDTALRIGFNLKIYPNQVYVQSGVIKGVKKIFNGKTPAGRSLPLNAFPDQLQVLEPYEIENFMCIWGKTSLKKSC